MQEMIIPKFQRNYSWNSAKAEPIDVLGIMSGEPIAIEDAIIDGEERIKSMKKMRGF